MRRVTIRKGFALWAGLMAAPLMALDPSRSITQYGISSWRAEDGMPPTYVTAIAQTSDGYLWFGTATGLGRFDGVRFTVFDGSNTPALATTRHIGGLLPSPDGSLWIGRGDGLARYKAGRFISYPATAMADGFIWSLAAGQDDSIWIGTYAGGLNRLRAGKFSVEIPSDRSTTGAIWATHVTRDGAIWTGTNGLGLNRWFHGRVVNFTTRDGLANNIVWAIHEDRSGALWVGTNGGLNRLQRGKMTTFTTANGLSSNCVKAILEDRDGNLWIGTEGGGLNRYRDGKFSSIGMDQGLSDSTVLSLLEDREGSLWIGTPAGVTQLRQESVINLTRFEGLGNDSVWAVREAADGALLLGTAGGFSRWKDGKTMNLSTREGLSSNVVRSVVEDADGSLWLATNDGLNHYRNGKVKVYRTSDGLPHDMVRTVSRDREGNLWVGTRGGGLARYRNGAFTVFDTKNSALPHNVVSSVDEDADGSLWIATNGGMSVLKNGVFRNYGLQDGLSNLQTRMTYHDRDGSHWIGTFGGGLNRLKNGRIAAIRASNGLFDDVVYSIVEDDAGFLWMTGLRGIFRVRKQELNELADGKRSSVHSYPLGIEDGMRIAEVKAGFPAVWKGAAGRLFFPTSLGVTVVDPRKRTLLPRPMVWNEEILADGKRGTINGDEVTVGPGSHSLEIRYTALTFIAQRKVEFRYRLRGFDNEWVEAGGRRSAFYTNLKPGSYTFEVLAGRGDGVWTEARNPIRFRVEAAFFETWWFAVSCLVLVVLAVGGAFRMRLELLKRRESLLVRRVDEQTAQLSYANAHKQLILNSAGEGIFGLDANGTATFVNPAAARMLGWQAEDLVGRNLHEIIHDTTSGQMEPRDWCALCTATMRPTTGSPLAAEFHRRGGGTVPVECTAGTIVGADGVDRGVVVTFSDVSERMAVDQLKDEFVSTVSHELRTPLTSIRGALGLLSSGMLGSLAEQGQRMLNMAITNTDRLTRLINDILDLERIDSGTMTLNRGSMAVQDLIEEAAEGVRSLAEQSGVMIVCESIHASVWVDHDRMIQVVTNLLSNAIKFSPSGSIVRLSGACNDAGDFTLRVEDQGRGVPEEKFKMIFERFKQVDATDSRQKGGTGLGLAICRRIVELHGGRIWVESNHGAGSVFQFTIPYPYAA
jgi:PAS domain S-box-containing protein